MVTLKYWDKNKDYFPNLEDSEYNALKEDIKQNGLINPLHILEDGTVICGNQRLKACLELKMPLDTIPTKVVNLKNETEIILYAIKENLLRRQLTSEQKAKPVSVYVKLKEQLAQGRIGRPTSDKKVDNLSTIKSRDIVAKEVGIGSGRTLDRLIQYQKTIDEKPELKGEKISVALKKAKKEKKLKEIKQIVEDKLIEGLLHNDCLVELGVMENESVDLCIIDPPYNIGFKSARGVGTNDFDDNISEDTLKDIFAEIYRVLKKDSHLYCFIGFQTYGDFKGIIEDIGFEFRNCLIWVKNNHTPTNYDLNYAHKYEMIIFATKGKRPLNNKLSVDVLNFDNLQGKVHNSEKPVDLLKYLIENSSFEKEVVLDCFMGSGSTCVASKLNNRNFIGIEKEEEFYDIARKRIIDLDKKDGNI